MTFRKKIVIILLVLMVSLVFIHQILRVAADYRVNSEYVDCLSPSADGRCFYLTRDYMFSRQTATNQPCDIINEFYVFDTCSKPGVKINRIEKKNDGSFYETYHTIRNRKVYIAFKNISANKSKESKFSELRFYPILGKPITKQVKSGYIGVVFDNIILYKENLGFYHYDPLNDKMTFLCLRPNIKRDAQEWIRKYAKGKKIDPSSIQKDHFNIIRGNQPGDFVLKTDVYTLDDKTISLSYFHNAGSHRLHSTLPLKSTIDGYPIDLDLYATYDDRYITADRDDSIVLDTKNNKVISLNLTVMRGDVDYLFSPDLKSAFFIDIDRTSIYMADTKTGVRSVIYTESRPDYTIMEMIWFPKEKRIIALVSFNRTMNRQNKLFTEIIAIDPSTGSVKVISPACPYYTRRNDKYFAFMCKVSDKAKPIADKIDKWLGFR
jgi:hypothetical protein